MNHAVAAGVEPANPGTPQLPTGSPGRWLREPLLLFLIAGALLFAAYRLLNPPEPPRIGGAAEAGPAGGDNRIVITRDDLVQMSAAWLAQGRPALTPEQWQSLIEAKVREEVMFREALRLGLDRNDAIIKRRLMQKMEFLAEDTAAASPPTDAQLRAWFAARKDEFAYPGRVSFSHLYFSPDKRRTRAKADSAATLRKIGGLSDTDPRATAQGDPFMFEDQYAERTPDQMAKEFGPGFANALFALKPGAWRGPIESGYGWHLVYVEGFAAPEYPPFEAVAEDVKAQWLAEASAKAKAEGYAKLRAGYTIELPPPPTAAELAAARPAAPGPAKPAAQ